MDKGTNKKSRISFPSMAAPYRQVYFPQSDIYRGIDTPSFQNGVRYDEWIPNDFTLIRDKNTGILHAYGITHPKPPSFADDFNFSEDIHEAEFQLFHCTFDGTLDELYNGGHFTECEKILYPQSRPDQRRECWAPCIVEKGGLYYLYHTPGDMNVSFSCDLYHFTPHPKPLFSGMPFMRDPYIFFENGIYTMVYTADHLYYRTSADLLCWSEEHRFQTNPFPSGAQESPCIFAHDGIYYLMWCIHDGTNGCYDNRTYVFAADSLSGFENKAPVALLYGHAPEIFTENGKSYIFSVFYPANGLSIAPISYICT